MSTSNPHEPPFDVVVTRDAARAAPLATALAAHGARVVPLPCTRTEAPPPEAWQLAVARVGDAARYDAVVVPSATAADALARAVAAAGAPPPPRVLAIGPVTRGALARAGIAADAPARADATGAADALLAGAPPRAVLWLRAEDGRTEGIDRLRAAGVEVDEAVVYRTTARRADDPEVAAGLTALPGAAVIAVYAPSQAVALDALLAGRGGLAGVAAAIVAIGDTTADAVRELGARVAAVADAPDADAMARAVVRVYPTKP